MTSLKKIQADDGEQRRLEAQLEAMFKDCIDFRRLEWRSFWGIRSWGVLTNDHHFFVEQHGDGVLVLAESEPVGRRMVDAKVSLKIAAYKLSTLPLRTGILGTRGKTINSSKCTVDVSEIR